MKLPMSTTLVPFTLVLVVCAATLPSCSTPESYDDAMTLIRQHKWQEAKAKLQGVPKNDSTRKRIAAALLTCDIGMLFDARQFNQAHALVDSMVAVGDGMYFVYNVSPGDPQFPVAATLAHLVHGEWELANVNAWLDAVEKNPSLLEITEYDRPVLDRELRKGRRGAQFRDVDTCEAAEPYPAPYVRSIGFDNLPPLPEYQQVIGDLLTRITQAITRYDDVMKRLAGR